MPLVPFLLAAKSAHELIQLARKSLAHFRAMAPQEQERLRGEAHRVRALSAELGAATAHSVRGRVRRSAASDHKDGRDVNAIAAELRGALACFISSSTHEVATIAKGESLRVRYAAKAVGYGVRRLDPARGAGKSKALQRGRSTAAPVDSDQ